jgi:hypothetical protein
MRLLFYLPNITPWWFDNMIAPLVRALAPEVEVHVMVPPMWRSTGVTPGQLAPFADGPAVEWHVLDEIEPGLLRRAGSSDAAIRDLVRRIDPDITLCRCADPEVIHGFPGVVRFVMEGAAHPIANGGSTIIFPTRLFEHGAMPPLTAELEAQLDAAFTPVWTHFAPKLRGDGAPSWRVAAGIDPGRPVVSVPIEYDFEDSFNGPHQYFRDNHALIDAVADAFGDDVFLAFTNHPLNDLYGDNRAVEAHIAKLGARAAIIRPPAEGIKATEMVARDCDGAVVDLSKSYLAYACFGVPIVRPTAIATAPWLNAMTDLDAFASVLAAGQAVAPSPDATRLWFAHHIANAALDTGNPALDAAMVLDHIVRPLNPARWEGNLKRFATLLSEDAGREALVA